MTTNLKDVPNELLEKIREQFEKNNQVRELRVRQQRLQREGKWMESLGVAKQIESLYDKVVCEYLQESERQVSTIDISDMDIPKSDKDAYDRDEHKGYGRYSSSSRQRFACRDLR